MHRFINALKHRNRSRLSIIRSSALCGSRRSNYSIDQHDCVPSCRALHGFSVGVRRIHSAPYLVSRNSFVSNRCCRCEGERVHFSVLRFVRVNEWRAIFAFRVSMQQVRTSHTHHTHTHTHTSSCNISTYTSFALASCSHLGHAHTHSLTHGYTESEWIIFSFATPQWKAKCEQKKSICII